MSIEFPLPQKETAFGWISDPRIAVLVRTRRGPLVLEFLVDTGADFAVAPRGLAAVIGLDGEIMPDAQITGIGATRVPVRIGQLPIRLGDHDLTIRCLFVDSPRPLLILGRADFLDRFVLTIDLPRRRIALEAVDV